MAGTKLEAALTALNARGYRIVYSSALVLPDMTLRAAPQSERIDALLREILAPWNLRAIPAANGTALRCPQRTASNLWRAPSAMARAAH